MRPLPHAAGVFMHGLAATASLCTVFRHYQQAWCGVDAKQNSAFFPYLLRDTTMQVDMDDEAIGGLNTVASTVVEDLMRSMHDSPGVRSNGSAPSARSGITSYIVVTHQHSTIRRAVDRLIFLHEVRPEAF